jgi:hypothetical protein
LRLPSRVSQVRGDHNGVAQVTGAEVRGELGSGVQVVHRDAEEPVHLRGVQCHGKHAVGAGGGEQIGDQAGTDGDSRGVLLVGAGVRVVRYDRGDPGRRGASRRIQHQQQLHQVLLYRRDQRLDEVHVPLTAVRPKLDFEAVIGEPGCSGRLQRNPEVVADRGCELRVGTSGEHRDLPHAGHCARATRTRVVVSAKS